MLETSIVKPITEQQAVHGTKIGNELIGLERFTNLINAMIINN